MIYSTVMGIFTLPFGDLLIHSHPELIDVFLQHFLNEGKNLFFGSE